MKKLILIIALFGFYSSFGQDIKLLGSFNTGVQCTKLYQLEFNCAELFYNSIIVGEDTFIRVFKNTNDDKTIHIITATSAGVFEVPAKEEIFIEIVSCNANIGGQTKIELRCNSSETIGEPFILN